MTIQTAPWTTKTSGVRARLLKLSPQLTEHTNRQSTRTSTVETSICSRLLTTSIDQSLPPLAARAIATPSVLTGPTTQLTFHLNRVTTGLTISNRSSNALRGKENSWPRSGPSSSTGPSHMSEPVWITREKRAAICKKCKISLFRSLPF